MIVSAVSLKTHAYLPIGATPDGKPVYAIYTAADGSYTLYLPAEESGNVLVVASPPERSDERLAVGDVTPVKPAAQPRVLDESTAQAVRNARDVMANQLARMMTATDVNSELNTLQGGKTVFPEAVLPLMRKFIQGINDFGRQLGVPTTPGAQDIPEVRELSYIACDATLGFLDYDALRTNPAIRGLHRPAGASFRGHGQIFAALEARTATYMQEHLAKGETLPLDVVVPIFHAIDYRSDNCVKQAHVPLSKASDIGVFLSNDVLSRYTIDNYYDLRRTFRALGPALDPPATPTHDPRDPAVYLDPTVNDYIDYGDRLEAATVAVLFTIATQVAGSDGPPALSAALAAGKAYLATHPRSAPQPAPLHRRRALLPARPARPTPGRRLARPRARRRRHRHALRETRRRRHALKPVSGTRTRRCP